MPREPPVIRAALPAREIMTPPIEPENRNWKIETGNSSCLRLVRHGLVSRACGRNELAEQALRKRILVHPFGMPLHTRNPVGIPDPFDPFDRAVRSARGNVQIPPWLLNRLVVRAVA